MSKKAAEYAEVLGLNTEDVRTLFEICIETLYDGDRERFLDDLDCGVIFTQDGPELAHECLDSMAMDTLL